MKLLRLRVCGGVQFGMRDRHRSEASDCCHQRSLLSGEYAVLPGIDQDRTLGSGRAKGRRDQHSRRHQIAERMRVGSDREG